VGYGRDQNGFPLPSGPALVSGAGPREDIFARFSAEAAARGTSPQALFQKYDAGGTGWLSLTQAGAMLQEAVPAASAGDSQHFLTMLEPQQNGYVSQVGLPLRLLLQYIHLFPSSLPVTSPIFLPRPQQAAFLTSLQKSQDMHAKVRGRYGRVIAE
jgi:hypothetical protein